MDHLFTEEKLWTDTQTDSSVCRVHAELKSTSQIQYLWINWMSQIQYLWIKDTVCLKTGFWYLLVQRNKEKFGKFKLFNGTVEEKLKIEKLFEDNCKVLQNLRNSELRICVNPIFKGPCDWCFIVMSAELFRFGKGSFPSWKEAKLYL